MIECYELYDNEWLKGIFDKRHCWVLVYVRDIFFGQRQKRDGLDSAFSLTISSRAAWVLQDEQ